MIEGLKRRLALALEARGIWAWFNNLSLDKRRGSFPLEGRLFVHRHNDTFSFEYNVGSRRCGFSLGSSPWEAEVRASVAFPGLALYTRMTSFSLLGKLTGFIGHRIARVDLHDGAIWWETPLADPDVGRSNEPWYVRGNFSVVDALLGKPVVTKSVVVRDEPVTIPMLEGNYEGTCSIEQVTTGRPRWFGETVRIATVRIENGIPIPGKGENSYDLDEDALYAQSAPASSPAEAVGNVVGSVLVTRWKRAGANWRPEPRPMSVSAPVPAAPAAVN
jgi:hypothetical protein